MKTLFFNVTDLTYFIKIAQVVQNHIIHQVDAIVLKNKWQTIKIKVNVWAHYVNTFQNIMAL